jgi:type III secretion system FlhB-like substrate exporter
MREQTVEKIVIHYSEKDEKPKVIKAGFALFLQNNRQDAEMQFVGIENKEELFALLRAVQHSIKFAINTFDTAQEIEKEKKPKS